MTEQDKLAFAETMATMAENFNAEISTPGMRMRFEALREYALRDVQAAAASIMRSRKFTKMPTLAEFVEHLSGGSITDRASVEAVKARQAISHHGGYASVCFDDPVTQAVIEDGLGGWPQFCADYREPDRQWWDKEFVRLYTAFSAGRRQRFGYLAGQHELHNLAHAGGRFVDPPRLVGDKQRAQAVLAAGAECPAIEGARDTGALAQQVLERMPVMHGEETPQ